jgi:hypothetical protein
MMMQLVTLLLTVPGKRPSCHEAGVTNQLGQNVPNLPGERSHLADEHPQQTGIVVTQTGMMHLNRVFRHGNSGGDALLPIEARVLRA